MTSSCTPELCLRCEEIETFCCCSKSAFDAGELITEWRTALRVIKANSDPPSVAYYTAYNALGRQTT